MPLLADNLFDPVMEVFTGKRVGFLIVDGNVGDDLIRDATVQLFDEYAIDYHVLSREELKTGALARSIDIVACMGGGNLGKTYSICFNQRLMAQKLGKPLVIMPQSIIDAEEDLTVYQQVFLRERASQKAYQTSSLAPDMALALVPPMANADSRYATGVFLREDQEQRFADYRFNLADPAAISSNTEEYFELASHFQHIVTDRLHFAIAGLIMGRRVTLLPNSYYKNRSMYDTWLKDLGCNWLDNPEPVQVENEDTLAGLYKRLSGSPRQCIPWHARITSIAEQRLSEQDTFTNHILDLIGAGTSVDELYQGLLQEGQHDHLVLGSGLQHTLSQLIKNNQIKQHLPVDLAVGSSSQKRQRRHMHLLVHEPRTDNGTHTISATLTTPDGEEIDRWFSVSEEHSNLVNNNADPFVLSCLYRSMQEHVDLQVHGAPVSRHLLRNLAEFQQVWPAWKKSLGSIDIHAEAEWQLLPKPDRAVLAFSGGVDSCFSAISRQNRDNHPYQPPLAMAVHIGGMDQTVNDPNSFSATHQRLSKIVENMNFPLISMQTNIRHGTPDWEHSHGTLLAAALHSLSGEFGQGIISSTAPYELLFPWGSNPVSDHWLSSHHMEIWHEGAGLRRFEKIRALKPWPEIVRSLRVCWRNRNTQENCGVCGKCRFTLLALQSLDMPLEAFQNIPDENDMANWLQQSTLSMLDKNDGWDIAEAAYRSMPGVDWFEILAGKTGYLKNSLEKKLRY
ncbi:MAG: exopolysaccharide biosynthesis predicted pyruvyl transferase EpsI [Parasphingorhabdus sp.]|jgi:exopolysaccharide biosynthesis predicted pyruvyltransferase EpsI